MNKLFIALVATAAIGLFSTMTDTASAQCGGGYYRGGVPYHGGHYYSYRPQTTIGFSYGTGFNNFYRPSYGYNTYYRPQPAFYGVPYHGYNGFRGCNRGGVGFSIRF